MIKLGITACIMPPDSTRGTFSKKDLFYVESDMVHYLNTDKSIPLIIPSFKQEKDLHRFIDQLDAVVIHGGVDVCPESYNENFHAVEFLEDSVLANEIYVDSGREGFVNSIHHQAIKKLGTNLKVEAISPDDKIIEAFKYDCDDNFIYGVQWHPEFNHTLGDKLVGADSLLEYFISQISKK